MDNEEFTVGVFVDLKKAFDTVDHSILIKKGQFYGVWGVALHWVQSYSSNCYQHVMVQCLQIYNQPVSCGVTQGSILGQLFFFILYINDIGNCSKLSVNVQKTNYIV